ncbi:MAG: sugar ABC transporter substrate-binding protein [Sphaerochaeta sp.]|jgi:multiple sugar transport system substrate-binding protein
MKRQMKLMVMVLVFFVFVIASVGAAGAKESKPDQPVTVKVWKGSWWNDQAPIVAKAFNDTHFNQVDIQAYPFDGLVEKYVISILGNQAADILAVDNNMLPLLINEGLLLPIEGVEKSDFSGAIWDAASKDGVLYGVPFRADTSGVFYNKGMFDEAGIAYPQDDWTWDDLLEIALKLTKGTDRYGFGISGSAAAATDFEAEVLPIIWAYGGEVIRDGKMALNEPEAIAGLQYWVDLVLKHKVSPSGAVNYDNKDYIEFFLNKKVAMMMGGSNVIPMLQEQAKDIDWDFVPVPGFSKGFGVAYAIPISTKHPEVAREYIDWFTNPEILAEYTIRMPARSSATTSPPWNDPMYGKVMNAAVASKSPPNDPAWVDIRAMMITEMQKVLTGQTKSVAEAAKIMNEQGNSLLNR